MHEDDTAQPHFVFPRPEVDPAEAPTLVNFGRREIAFARLGALALGLVACGGAILVHPRFLLLLPLAAGCGLVLPLFFRNPRRLVPLTPGVLVAPADGTVADVTQVREDTFLKAEALRIRIQTPLTRAHVNRLPCSGRVLHVERGGEAGGECIATELEPDEAGAPAGERLLVKQLAGRGAPRVFCRVRPGDRVWRGGLFGMIMYRARTELYIPLRADAPLDVRVETGTRVRAGVSVIAQWRQPQES